MGVVNLLEAKSRMELREWLIFLFFWGVFVYIYIQLIFTAFRFLNFDVKVSALTIF